jgi:site-specific recombinase XerD
MKRSQPPMDEILEAQIQVLATTWRPKTVRCYRYCAHNFRAYLHTTFPRLHNLSQLRRDPHLLAWFRFLCQQYPSPGNRTRHLHLLTVRRLLRDLVNQGHPVTPDLIRHEDFPPPDHYLPKPLSLEEDQHLQQQLRLADTLEVNALRLMRATGIRISECINLPLDCLLQISEQQVALRVPLGKLHSERLVPVDEDLKRQRPMAGIQDAERLSSLHAKRVAAISATWFTRSSGKTVPRGRASLMSSAVGDMKSFSM